MFKKFKLGVIDKILKKDAECILSRTAYSLIFIFKDLAFLILYKLFTPSKINVNNITMI